MEHVNYQTSVEETYEWNVAIPTNGSQMDSNLERFIQNSIASAGG